MVDAVCSDPILSKMWISGVTFLEDQIFEAKSVDVARRYFLMIAPSVSKDEGGEKRKPANLVTRLLFNPILNIELSRERLGCHFRCLYCFIDHCIQGRVVRGPLRNRIPEPRQDGKMIFRGRRLSRH